MPDDLDQLDFFHRLAVPLAAYWASVALLPALRAAWLWRRGVRGRAATWTAAALLLAAASVAALLLPPEQLAGLGLPFAVRQACNAALGGWWGPLVWFGLLAALLAVGLGLRRWLVTGEAGTALLVGSLVWLGLSLTDRHFHARATAPDHLAILGMIYLFAGCTWLAARQAVRNDERRRRGKPPLEAVRKEKILTWPDLVTIELIAMLLLAAGLIAWAMLVPAPLEAPANPAATPNPAKAPWFLVGVQELLLYFDAWYAGSAMLLIALLGLAAIPYLDPNRRSTGYYSIAERPLATAVFLGGLLLLWIGPLLAAAFFRGPDWAFYGPYQSWEAPVAVAHANTDLATYFWTGLLGGAKPAAKEGAPRMTRFAYAAWRELPGLLLLLAYFTALPIALGRTCLRAARASMGAARYWTMIVLLLLMLLVPVKMVLHWTAGLSYFVSFPELMLHF